MTTPNIQIPNIDFEIAKLNEEGKKRGEQNACLFNLIIYTEDKHRAAFFKEVIKTITETYPCRLMVIECARESKNEYLKVSVAHEVVKKNDSTITCDRINIDCTSNYLNRIPYLLLPNLVADLPVYLLWGQDPNQENEILPYLQAFAKRLIFDSDSAEKISTFCQNMLSNKQLAKVPVTDVNWASLTSWRDILSQVFDTQKKLEHLRKAETITIHYNNCINDLYKHTERRALYLQGWLAAQLKWKYITSTKNEKEIILEYKNEAGKTKIIITGSSIPELTPGAIVNIEIHTFDQNLYKLDRKNLEPFITAQICSKSACEQPISLPLRHSKKGAEFIKEILLVSCSKHYWDMLKALEPLEIIC